jgi:hypothetical protein
VAAYRETASLSAAAEAAGIPATQHYERLERDPRYWQAFEEVQQEVASALYDELLELAFYERAEPVLASEPAGRSRAGLLRFGSRLPTSRQRYAR